ncbi:MAG: PcfJ domain-containing protein [Dysgonamonadaceae bacterium]|jgi:hypothetical protein|nr:PcfJ domain-containing protein [Dysgonamonadaceae bacterium]
MKPKNKFQKQIFELSKKLPPITETQVKWAYLNCFEHFGFRTKKGVITCLECGTSWKSEQILIDSICGCSCLNCRIELKIKDTRKKTFRDYQYFCIITTFKGFQVLRFFYVSYEAKAGVEAKYFHSEVLQKWIAPDGKNVTVARLQIASYLGGNWNFKSNLEIRPNRNHHNIMPACIYPRQRLIPEIKRSGYRRNFFKLTPFDLFHALLTESKAETLLKAGQTPLLKYFTDSSSRNISDYWPSVKICIRNGYQITDASIWCDYINLLRFFEKDLHNAKYVCPIDLKAEHDRYVRKKREWQKQQDREKAKRKALKDNERFTELKSRFFGICFTDGLIHVRVLESVDEIIQEGDVLKHCVFTNDYHLKPDSLILSACIDNKRIETIEVSLSKLKILQSRGVCNKNTEYHDVIIALVKKNIHLIRKRLKAA